VEEALKRGALAAVVERDLKGERIVKVPSTRKALAESAHLFFGRPSEKLKVVGITGTNGKTTTAHILERILYRAGYKPGLIGTAGYRLGRKVFGRGRTTPESVLWQRLLMDMHREGATHVVAEVSSHALDQQRVWGTLFEAVVFTNLTHDHLDYHGTMEEYFRAKSRLFTEYEYRFGVVNSDCPYGRRLAELLKGKVRTFGREGDLTIKDFRTDFAGSEILITYRGANPVRCCVPLKWV